MIEKITVDSSVIITSIISSEKKHKDALLVIESILSGGSKAILPYSVLVEVVVAVKRRTASEATANEIKDKLLNSVNITFVELTKERAEKACHVASQFNLRGMDAIVVQVSKEFNTQLITFDKEMLSRISVK